MSTTPRLDGQVALITGSATGIGRETALAFAREGAAVVINYSRSEAEARQTQDDVAALGVRTLLCRADVSDDAAVREMVGQTVKAFGRLDVLVNNAGTTHFVPFEQLDDLTDDIWDRIFAVNVKGAFYCTAGRGAAPASDRRGAGGQRGIGGGVQRDRQQHGLCGIQGCADYLDSLPSARAGAGHPRQRGRAGSGEDALGGGTRGARGAAGPRRAHAPAGRGRRRGQRDREPRHAFHVPDRRDHRRGWRPAPAVGVRDLSL